MPPPRAARHPLALLFLLAGTACFSQSVAGSSLDAVGHWTLTSYGGALPAVVPSAEGTLVEVIGGTLDLDADGAYRLATTYRLTQGGVATLRTDAGSGTWFASGGQITLARTASVGAASATYSSAGIVMYVPIEDGHLLAIVYTR